MMVDQHPEIEVEQESSSDKWSAIMIIYITALSISVISLFSGALDFGNRTLIFLSLVAFFSIPIDVFKIRGFIEPALHAYPYFKIKPNPIKFTILHLSFSLALLGISLGGLVRVVKNVILFETATYSIKISSVLLVGICILFFYDFLTTHPLKHLMLGQPSWSKTKFTSFSDKKLVFILRGAYILFAVWLSFNLNLDPGYLLAISFFGTIIILTISYNTERTFFLNAAHQVIEETKDSIPLGVNPKDSTRKWSFLSALGLEDDPMHDPSVAEVTSTTNSPSSIQPSPNEKTINTTIDHPLASKTLQKLIAKVKEENDGGKPTDVGPFGQSDGAFSFCMNCGTRNNSLNTYCHACGASLQI